MKRPPIVTPPNVDRLSTCSSENITVDIVDISFVLLMLNTQFHSTRQLNFIRMEFSLVPVKHVTNNIRDGIQLEASEERTVTKAVTVPKKMALALQHQYTIDQDTSE